jgi:DNA helicase-2/ATP-dependent DNA helicase PcrA
MSVDRQFTRARLSPFLSDISSALYISSGRSLARFGSYERGSREYSQTLGGRIGRGISGGSKNRSGSQLRNASTLDKGQVVKHPFFGRGVIERVTGERTVEVNFDRHGMKMLHLDYAKLEKVKG